MRPPPLPNKGKPEPSTATIVLTLTASGSVGDYPDTTSLRQKVANAAGVEQENVEIRVVAASVLITATIAVPAATTASAVQSSLLFTLSGSAESVFAALGVTVESSPTIVIVLPPPAPPPSAPPPSSPWEDTSIDGGDDVACNVFCDANLGYEIYILLGGIGLTVAVLCFAAYSKVQVKLSGAEILSTLLAAGDALSDIAFTMQRLGIVHTTADQVVAALLLLFVLLPTAASASQVLVVLRSPHLDSERMKELSAFYAFVLLVALTNMELLRLLPWRQGPTMYDGLPDKRLMLRIWLLVTCLEDVPQLAIQVTVLAIADTGGVLAPLSIAFSICAIVWRGLRKMIYLMPLPNGRISEATVSGRDNAPQPPDNTPSAIDASVTSDTTPPAYGGVDIEHVEVLEKS